MSTASFTFFKSFETIIITIAAIVYKLIAKTMLRIIIPFWFIIFAISRIILIKAMLTVSNFWFTFRLSFTFWFPFALSIIWSFTTWCFSCWFFITSVKTRLFVIESILISAATTVVELPTTQFLGIVIPFGCVIVTFTNFSRQLTQILFYILLRFFFYKNIY